MARYATITATEIRPQRDSNPVLTSTSQQIVDMRFTITIKPTRHDHMLHRTGLLIAAQVRGSKASFVTSNLCLYQQPSSVKHMIMQLGYQYWYNTNGSFDNKQED